ncbi:hypothetical protein OUZ56_027135 [Daphnia magna]|uniref:Uncharacterized protein n=1 Tax=Daphnia magna TaxID=35525 RepID=A0ABQ9ZNW4_9CRUS|nr:hypothetical protein OUZ56_027135 [Daphnia magna]
MYNLLINVDPSCSGCGLVVKRLKKQRVSTESTCPSKRHPKSLNREIVKEFKRHGIRSQFPRIEIDVGTVFVNRPLGVAGCNTAINKPSVVGRPCQVHLPPPKRFRDGTSVSSDGKPNVAEEHLIK